MKEAIAHAVNNTVQPVLYGRLENPEFPPYLKALSEEIAETDTLLEDEGADVISLDETNRKG